MNFSVYGILIEYLSRLSPEALVKMDRYLYDDMCHLKPFSEKKIVMDQNEVTRSFGAAYKAVDKFHFPGHVSKKCHETCDPYKMPCFDDINSPVCEQVFSRLNKFTQVKGMNECHFLFFFIYLLDLQNLAIEGRLRSVANPLSSERKQIVQKAYKDKSVMDEIPKELAIPAIPAKESENIEAMMGYKEDLFQCQMCEARYKHRGSLNKHSKQKHGAHQGLFFCQHCDAKFQTKKQHTRHAQNHNNKFADNLQCQKCKKIYKIQKYFVKHVSQC